MLNSFFQNKFPFTYNYFSNLLELVFDKKREFPQALIFEGADTKIQYLFSLELARILNCTENKENNCNCINCKWIKTFSHPAIINVSQIHFKPDGDETKTMISVKQAREIEKTLSLSSDYHRFFIFFSSNEKEYQKNELIEFQNLGYNQEINFSIEPLTFQTFNPAVPNALLKSIEEPPKRTTFIFLTKSKEDILSTIVSRCQVFKLSGKKEKIDFSDIQNIFLNYPQIDYCTAFEISDNILNYIKNNQEEIEKVLNKIILYLTEILKQNINNQNLYLKIKNDINIINTAIKHSRMNMNDKTVLETMMLKIARGY